MEAPHFEREKKPSSERKTGAPGAGEEVAYSFAFEVATICDFNCPLDKLKKTHRNMIAIQLEPTTSDGDGFGAKHFIAALASHKPVQARIDLGGTSRTWCSSAWFHFLRFRKNNFGFALITSSRAVHLKNT